MTKLDGTTFTKQRTKLSDGDYAGINHLYGPVNSTSATNGTYTLTTSLAGDKMLILPEAQQLRAPM